MKTFLEPLQVLIEYKLYRLKRDRVEVKVRIILDMLEDSLSSAPGCIICMLDEAEVLRRYGRNYVGFTVCHKRSGERMDGGCDIIIKYSKDNHEYGIIEAIRFNNKVL